VRNNADSDDDDDGDADAFQTADEETAEGPEENFFDASESTDPKVENKFRFFD
jgi:hypothetical protein